MLTMTSPAPRGQMPWPRAAEPVRAASPKTARVNHRGLAFRLIATLSAWFLAEPSAAQPIDTSSQELRNVSITRLGLGEYRSAGPLFSKAVRRSLYVQTRDGTRLAVDYYIPSGSSIRSTRRFPVVFMYERYARIEPTTDGNLVYYGVTSGPDGSVTLRDDPSNPVSTLLRHGYVLVVAQLRGTGASFGATPYEHADVEARDGKDVVDWIAKQPWSTGKVGMYGASYLAEDQPVVASARPRALKALAMVEAVFDGANAAYSMGGIYRYGWANAWDDRVSLLDGRSAEEKAIAEVVPVDTDKDRVLLRRAITEHQGQRQGDTWTAHEREFASLGVVRDKLSFLDVHQSIGENNPSVYLPAVNRAAVPTLLIGGWSDLYATDMLLWYANLTGRRKLVYGPYSHGLLGPGANPRQDEFNRVRSSETLRWFDYWLKGVANDAMSRPNLQFGLPSDHLDTRWFGSSSWPLSSTTTSVYYLGPAHTGTIWSQNDGSLVGSAPTADVAQDWTVDYKTSTGTAGARWWYRAGVYPVDMVSNDYRSMTYTTVALDHDLAIAGTPVVTISVARASVGVMDFYAYLSEVQADGSSKLITEGMLRSSHRTLGTSPYNNYGVPFPSSRMSDLASTPDLGIGPTQLRFPLIATGKILRAGTRLRLTISGADRDNTVTTPITPAPHLQILLGPSSQSRLELPVIPLTGASPN